MDERLIPVDKIFRSNEGLFRAALDGVDGGNGATDDDSGAPDATLEACR